MNRELVHAPEAPAAVGPYSHAVVAGGLVFASGQIALDPQTGEVVGDDVATQTRLALENLGRVLAAAGSGLDRAVRLTVYLADLADFAAMNRVYAEFFPADPPARVCVAVRGLPRGALVEIEAVAVASSPA